MGARLEITLFYESKRRLIEDETIITDQPSRIRRFRLGIAFLPAGTNNSDNVEFEPNKMKYVGYIELLRCIG